LTSPPCPALPSALAYRAAEAAEYECLFALRTLAMARGQATPKQLEPIDPQHLKQSFLADMQGADAHIILHDGVEIGFYALRRANDELLLSQLHLHPDWQQRGIGSAVLQHICEQARAQPACNGALYVSALRGSPANRFYERHGFVKVGQSVWDIFYRKVL
jgi:GNAT superfamily N-acetyltransferase